MTEREQELKLKRRGAKSKFTRLGNALDYAIRESRPAAEIDEAFKSYKDSYGDLESKHEAYTSLIVDDDSYEREENWMSECQDSFLKLQVRVKDYQQSTDLPSQHERDGESTQAASQSLSDIDSEQQRPTSSQAAFKMKKPKMPKFSGDIREYCIFKADFRHIMGQRYSGRDALIILRSCLTGKPLQHISGIGHDYEDAWAQLDLLYDDPCMVADAIISDISKFRSLKPGEDERFCNFANLVRRCANTLNEVGRSNDMDNSHMLAILERKLAAEDRKIWFRYQQSQGTASFQMFRDWLVFEMRARVRSTAPLRADTGKSSVNFVTSTKNQRAAEKKERLRCWICNSDKHWPDQCKDFINKTHSQKMELVRNNNICFSCLKKAGGGHRMNTCMRKRQCTEKYKGQQCKFYHHPLLHSEQEAIGAGIGVALTGSTEGILPVITAEFISAQHDVKEGNVLLDSGSQIAIIRQGFADQLQLQGKDIAVNITKVGEGVKELRTKIYRAQIRPVSGQRCYTVEAIALPYICEVQEIDIPSLAEIVKLPSTEIHRGSGQIDLLIGIDHPNMHTGKTKIHGNYLCIRKSPLGPVIFGLPGSRVEYGYGGSVLNIQLAPGPDLTDFWNVETMGVKSGCECQPSKMTRVEKSEFDQIWNSCEKVGKQWLIPYPWKDNPHKLPNNRVQAERMLEATEKKLAKNPEHAEAYSQQMDEMVGMGFARKLSDDEIKNYDGPVYYISHHSVLRPDKRSTPLRIVFNSSAIFGGHCLNEYWLKGPDLLNNLNGVLMRFREHVVAVCADISKMYHRVLIPIPDQHTHRYLWRGLNRKKEPETFVKTVVTFGDKPAAAMAQVALLRTADESKSMYPMAAMAIKRDTYMDDICTSVETTADAQKLTHEIDEVLSDGGFKVKGWLSNKQLQGANASQVKQEMKILESLAEEKVLGTVWNHETDEFSYKVQVSLDFNAPLTKRRILSQVARLFDPIGFASPFIVRAKIGMQRLWQLGVDWDEELPQNEKEHWRKLFKEMEELNNVALPRCLTPPNAVGLPTLCIFCDASEQAFGACAYLRWELGDGHYDVRFITAKSRVAPIKKLTLPRLELQAAVLAARLCATVKEELTLEVKDTVFMTDSMIVLGWIKSQARSYKSFVSARIGEIQSQSDPHQWRHIPGDVNPADDISRGIPVERLMERWLRGPEFLRSPRDEWPQRSITQKHPETDNEKLRVKQVASVTVETGFIDYNRFSSWRKLLRVTAYVLRFVNNLKSRCSTSSGRDEQVMKGPLSVPELESAEVYLIKEAQKPLHQRLKRQDFKTLSPFIDDGVIYVGGRAGKRVASYDNGHPVLLPQRHQISSLITRHAHNAGHSGVATTAAKVRAKYWVIGVHKLAKTIKHRCVVCRKMEHKTETQFMAELPEIRMSPFSPPFMYTSCDYFGPINVKVGRNKVTKHYGVIFTCLNTRAVHLDLAVDSSTMEYLQVLRRFFAFRGQPRVIVSDNGTQFIGAERELREMVKGWDNTQLRDFCAEKGVIWRFTTPSAPHQNGCAEALVKSCKFALKKAIGDQILTPFELYTCLVEVGNLVNQRPIGRVPNDPDDGHYLCPNDILLGRASSSIPQGPFRETKNPRHRVEFVQKIIDSFWKSWNRDVFPLLVPRKKWNVERRNVRVDDIVMLSDPNSIRGKWTLGRIVNVYPGSDGKIRNVKVKTANSEYSRPITKVVVIFPAEGYED